METYSTPKKGIETIFVALGGIWLDEICSPGKDTLIDIPGGSVAFGKTPSLTSSPITQLTVLW